MVEIKGSLGMKNITKEVEEMVRELDKLGKESDYCLEVDEVVLNKLKYIIENLFEY